MSDNEKIDFFLKQREELRDWPYTVHQLDDTLDMNLIEGRGKQLFFQGINTKRLTGFVGSGLSMAYGRMSWRDWKKTQLGAIEQFAKSFEDLSQESLNRIEQISALMHYWKGITAKEIEEVTKAKRLTEKQSHILTTLADTGFEGVDEKIDRHNILGWLKNRERAVQFARKEILKLHRLFKHANDDDGGFPGGEDAPIQFQVAEQLHTLLRQYIPLYVDLSKTDTNDPLERVITGVLHCTENGAPIDTIQNKLVPLIDSLDLAIPQVKLLLSSCGSSGEEFEKSFRNYYRIAHKPESRLSIEDMAKSLLVDECAHAEHLLLEGLRDPKELIDPTNEGGKYRDLRDKLRNDLNIHDARSLSRNVPGIRQDSDRYKVLSAFTLKNCISELQALLLRIKGQTAWESEIDALVQYLKDYCKRTNNDPSGQRYLLTPTSRFLISVAMRLDGRLRMPTTDGIKPENFTSRRSIVADRLDPLPKLVDGLNIHRFMTLNYDFEIERYFQDVGFRNFAVDDTDEHVADMGRMAQSDLRYDGVGAALRDLAFERSAASELISFAGGRDGAAYGVYHLHGRATQSGRLVINEHDYMELYLQEDENRETVDEAISMAFAANPLVFVGLGMNEADLLRPLRQFTSNRDHNTGYNAIALVPAEDGFSRRAKFSSGLYIRYGVHTIFYGSGAVKIPKDGGDPDLCSIDWLHRILALVRALTDLTKQRLKDGDLSAGLGSELSDEERAEKTLDYLEGKVGIFGEDLVQAHLGFDKNQHALPILMGRRDLKPGDFEFANPSRTKLISPLFTTVRGGANDQEKTVRAVNRAECLDGEPYLRFYLERLNSILHMTVDDKSNPQDIVGKRDLSARLAMLDGIYGAIITASLNAALAGLQAEHQRWWQNWRQCPPYRSARFERLGVLNEHQSFSMPRRHVRHRIHNTITTLENAEKQLALPIEADSDEEKLPPWVHKPSRFDNPNRTGVRTHDTFISAVARERLMRKKFDTDRGRRIYTIAAHRGLGKGSLMSAMATPKGLSGYIHAAWDHEDMPPLFTDAIFVNLSFSSEIASVYDMIDDALLASIAALGTFSRLCKGACGQKEQVKVARKFLQRFLWQQRWTILDYPKRLKTIQSKIQKLAATDPNSTALIKLYNYLCYLSFVIEIMGQKDSIAAKHSRLPRLERLRVLAKLYREESETVATEGGGVQPRVFMFLSAMDMLFTSDRLGKNKEIEALIALLTREQSNDLPFDIIFIGDETGLGWPWVSPSHDEKRLNLMTQTYKPAKLVRIDRSKLPETAKIAIKARIKNSQLDFETNRSKQKVLPKDTNFVHIARVVNPVNLLIDSFMPLAVCLHVGALSRDAEIMSDGGRNGLKAFAMWEDGRTSKECTADLLKAKNTLKTMQNPPWKEVILDISEEEVSEYDMEILLDGSKALSETMVKNCGSYLNQICSDSSPDRTLEKTGRDAASWHEIVERSQAGNATLDEIADLLRLRFRIEGSPDFDEWRNVRRTLGANRFSLTILLAAAQTLALREREIVKGAEIADQFISGVVDKVRTGSRAKRESLVLSSVLEVYRSLHVLAKPDDDYELHQLLLRHLAAIGSPTTVGVLVRLPEIRRYLTGLGEALPCSRTKFVGRAMHRLCMRGIVFRLSRHPRLQELQERKANLGDRPQFRYALHRSVQRHVMSHFGTMSTDVARANEYSPSLFASMPSGLPRLNHTSYRFLRELMLSLSQYPDIPLHAQDGEEWNFSSARRATQVQALRAALSMVRSSFSIAVVSRFEDYKDVKDAEIRKRGYFETYKVRLRWIIRKAWSLMSPERQSSARGQIGAHYRPDQEWDEVNALYRDEIVWLYNEVGLVCLVQGNLHDALGHLRQAGELNQHIEGRDEDGAMGHRISINRAICQMERGHIQAARRRLMDVRNDERDQNKGKIYYLATAHLGVCDHLLGNRERALKKLQKALSYLLSRKDFRASAVIGHQLALLYSLTDVDKARAELLNARRFAEAGGHEDVRRQIDITDVSLTIDHASALLDTREQYIDGSKTLLSVVDYARLMGVPALECEALIVRGRLLLAQNESTAAGAVLTRAMTLAKRNGMNLRLNRAMTLYGDVLIRRRQLIAAERLLYGSLEKAKNSQFRTEVSRIHRLLDQLRTMYSAV